MMQQNNTGDADDTVVGRPLNETLIHDDNDYSPLPRFKPDRPLTLRMGYVPRTTHMMLAISGTAVTAITWYNFPDCAANTWHTWMCTGSAIALTGAYPWGVRVRNTRIMTRILILTSIVAAACCTMIYLFVIRPTCDVTTDALAALVWTLAVQGYLCIVALITMVATVHAIRV